jgi:alpha-tubulin suppressor-like RCC1 family protein
MAACGQWAETQLASWAAELTTIPTNRSRFCQVMSAIAAGPAHSLFLKNDGSLWAMGYNYFGQLGDGTYDNTNQPEQIMPNNVTAIAAGGDDEEVTGHSLFLKSDGSLWAMGYDFFGQLGDGTYSPNVPNSGTNRPEQILASYNQLNGQFLSSSNLQLSFVGVAGANYALDSTYCLAPPNWIPLLTNSANSFGALVLTNIRNPATNIFWRIRSVQ